jgi:hypothetical protein
VVDSVATYDLSQIYDFGMCNRVISVRAQNIDTPLHEYPDLIPTTTGTPTFGSAGDEYLYVISAVKHDGQSTSSGKIEIKEGASVLSASPLFYLAEASNVTNLAGQSSRESYTFITAVRNSSGASGPVLTNCDLGALRGGKNLLTNGTFDGASTGWTFVNADGVASGDDLLVTPVSSSWEMRQDISGVCTYGKRYIGVAKANKEFRLALGRASSGLVGGQPVVGFSVSNIYGDGDSLSMISFQYLGQDTVISVGNLLNSSPVTFRWIALIECPD